jgi:UDP-N-acetyl-D-mannosaminuronic acid dehydrogenase
MKKLIVLGLGYIGLPTASMFATHGFKVIGVDVNNCVVETLNSGKIHLQEPGLKALVQAGLKSGNLQIKGEPELADIYIIAVPTPISPNKQADLNYVKAAANAIVPYLRPGNLVILESTIPPGTTRNILAPILSKSGLDPEKDLLVAHSPERVLPGRILVELVENARVIGGLTVEAAKAASDLYSVFVQGEIHLTNATAAEMVKLMENTFRDVNIALANEFAMVAEHLKIDVWEAISIANLHPRVNILRPGPGVGGHCIAVDPWFLVQAVPNPPQLITSARYINDNMPQHVTKQVQSLVADYPLPRIAVLGLAYKSDVDDIRESPAITVVQQLQKLGYTVTVHDPFVEMCDDINLVESVEAAATNADCLLVLTDHTSFKAIDPNSIKKVMRHSNVIDTRHILPAKAWQAAGFHIVTLGDGSS